MAQHVTTPVVCNRCDKQWPSDPVYSVECPDCDAGIGTPCVRPSGHAAWEWHTTRELAAATAGAYGTCPLGSCITPPIVEVDAGPQQFKLF